MKKIVAIISLLCINTVLFAETTVTYEPLDSGEGGYNTATSTSGYVAPTDYYYYRNVNRNGTCYTTAEPAGLVANVGPISVNTGGTTYSYYCY